MLQPLIITLREGVEAALVVGIIITYLAKTKKEHLKKYVYQGLAVAIAVSIEIAFIFARVALNEETFEGVVMWVAAGFIISMVIWMWKTGKRIRRDIEQRVERYSTAGQILGLFSLPSLWFCAKV